MIQPNWNENVCMRFRGIALTRRQVNKIVGKPSIVDNLILSDRLHPVVEGKQTRFDLEEVYRILPHFGPPTKPNKSLTN